MATSSFNIKGNVQVDGLKEATKEAKTLNVQLEKLEKPRRAQSNSAAKTIAYAKAASAQENTDYGVSRSAKQGGTGASARDFARQAEGLGGLVRLYATYAANIFAVGAAFRALSGAMDTANLIKGLDQIGASSGKALGSLAKDLVTATDGAISLREGMESVAKASSSGMSSDDILRMGKVAKQAAQALGVDMGDAVNRLTRGITKLEPELLDELGIFARVDASTKVYAKSVGKATSAITDFEKRQAFANAVLAEGEKKFGALDLEANPYTKLLATIKDLSYAGLSLVNTVLTPLITLLDKSPVALVSVLSGIGITLIRQAIPALGEMKNALKNNAEQALRTAEAFKTSFGDEFQDRLSKRFKIPDLEEDIRKIEKDINSVKLPKALPQSVTNISEKGILDEKNVNKVLETRRKIVETGMQGEKKATQSAIEGAKKEIFVIERQIALLQKKNELESGYNKAQDIADKRPGRFDPETVALIKYQKLRDRADKANIISNAAENARVVGIRGSWALLNEEIEQKGIKGVGKYTTAVRGGLAAVGSRITGVVASLGTIGMVIGAAVGAFALIDGIFSKNAKEVSAFKGAVEKSDEALTNLDRTLDSISKKPFDELFDAKSLSAVANAIAEVSDSITDLISSVQKSDKAASGWDRFIDGFKTVWGGDIRTKFSEELNSLINDSFAKLGDSPEVDAAKKEIASILNIDPRASADQWAEAFASIAQNAPKLAAVESAFSSFRKQMEITAAKSREFDDSLVSGTEAYKKFTDGFKVTNALSLLGESFVSMSSKTALAMEEPVAAIQKLSEVVKDSEQLKLFGDEDQALLRQYGQEITSTNTKFAEYKQRVSEGKKEVQQLTVALNELRGVDGAGQAYSDEQMSSSSAFVKAKEELEKKQAALRSDEKVLNTTTESMTRLAAKFPNLAANQLEKGASLIEAGLTAAMSKGSTAFAEAVMSAVGDLPGMAAKREQMDLAKLGSESSLIQAQLSLVRATMLNSAEIKLNSARLEQATASALNERNPENIGRVNAANRAVAETEVQVDIIRNASSNAKGAITAVRKAIADGNKEIQGDAEGLFNYISSIGGLVAQQQALGDQARAIKFKALVETVKEEFTERQKTLTLSQDQLTTDKQRITLAKGGANANVLNLLYEEQILDTKTASIATAQKQLAIEQKIAILKLAYEKGGNYGPSKDSYNKEISSLEKQALEVSKQGALELERVKVDSGKRVYDETMRQIGIEKTLSDITNKTLQDRVAAELQLIEIKNSANSETETFLSSYQAELDAELEAKKVVENAKTETENVNTAARIRLAELEAKAKQEIATSGSTSSETLNLINAEKDALQSKLGTIQKVKAAELSAIEQTEKARKKSEGFDKLIKSFDSIGNVFDTFGNGMSNVISAFQELNTIQEQNIATQNELNKKLLETNLTNEERAGLEQRKIELAREGASAELDSTSAVLGASKKLFKEKTVAYKALAAVEKGIAIAKLAMMVKEMVFDSNATAQAITNSAARATGAVGEAGVSAVAGVVNQSNGDPYSAFARMAAMGAIMAVLMASIGGKSPKVNGSSAASQQAVQGTGQDYVNGQLVDTGFGQLGDSTAKSTDIADSIDQLEKYAEHTLQYDFAALNALKAIQDNTKILASKLFNVQGLVNGNSAFGTKEASSISHDLFSLTKRTVQIVDSGIKANGMLFDMVNNPEKIFQQYETVEVKKKGIFGSKTKTIENTMSLDEEIAKILGQMFKDATKAIVELGKVFNMDTGAQLDELLKQTSVDFQVSAKGLSGEDLISALSAEIGTTTNAIVDQLYPFIKQFQQVGEGLLTTLTRINTEINTVNGLFQMMGIDFAESFLKPMTVMNTASETAAREAAEAKLKIEEAAVVEKAAATEKLTRAQIEADKTVEVSATVETQTDSLTLATEEYNAALAAETEAKYKQITENIKVYESLIQLSGGLEAFTEKATFFLDSFVPAAVKLDAITESVTDRMSELGYASVTTRKEFYDLVTSLDLSTQSGRELYASLMDVAPAFDSMIESTSSMLNEYGISVSGFKDTIRDAMLGRLTEEEIGTKLADMVIDGIYNALADQYAQQITDIFVEQIIAPAVKAAALGGSITSAVNVGAINKVVEEAKRAMQVLEIILNDPAIQESLRLIDGAFRSFARSSSRVVHATSYRTSSMNAAAEAANKIAEERFALESKLMNVLGLTAKLRERELATIDESNRYLQIQIWALEDTKKVLDDVFAKLRRSIEAEKERINDLLTEENVTKEKIDSVFEILRTNIDELLGAVVPQMMEAEAMLLIRNAVSSGILPDADKLSEAVAALRTGLETANYVSRIDQQRATFQLVGNLSGLKDLTANQKTESQQIIDSLESQLTVLDNQLESAQAAVDALNGIDNSIGDVNALLSQLYGSATSNYQAALAQSTAIVNAITNVTAAVQQISSSSGGSGGVVFGGGGSGGGSSAKPSTTWTPEGYASKNPDLVKEYDDNHGKKGWPSELSSLELYLKWHWETLGQTEKRQYRKGGLYGGGLALVGEDGPEVINFENPGMVYTAAQSSGILSGGISDEQARINKELLAQVELLRYEAQATAIHTGKLNKLLERLSRNGKSILVTDLVA